MDSIKPDTIYYENKPGFETRVCPPSLISLVRADVTLTSNKPAAVRIFSYATAFFPNGETALATLKERIKFIGVLSYSNNLINLVFGNLYGQMSALKAHAIMLKVIAKSIGYLSLIPTTFTSNLYVTTAISTLHIVSLTLLGTGLICSIANRINVIYYSSKSVYWRDCLSILSSSSIAYALLTKTMVYPPLLDPIRMVGHGCSNVVFLHKLCSFIKNRFFLPKPSIIVLIDSACAYQPLIKSSI